MLSWDAKLLACRILCHLLTLEMAQSLNVEKWGWDFSTLSGEATKVEKEFSP